MGAGDLTRLLESELPLHFEQYKAEEKRVGLVIVDEVNGFATVGAGSCVRPLPASLKATSSPDTPE